MKKSKSQISFSTRNSLKASNLKSQIYKGFTMIELLIVISILGIATTLITASYLSFEKRERVKSAALEMKNQIRFAQNKALSGDKGIDGDPNGFCNTGLGQILVGWYVNIDINSSSYYIAGDCQKPDTEEFTFAKKIYAMPEGIKVEDITYNRLPPVENKNSVNILYRPLENGSHFFDSMNPAKFLKAGDLDVTKLFGGVLNQDSVSITLMGFNTSYKIDVLPTGEVNEKKI